MLFDVELEDVEPEEMVAAGVAAAGNDACFNMETPLFGNSHPAGNMPELGDRICALHHISEKRDGNILCVVRTCTSRLPT